jgi:hypothetical protein
MSTLVSLRRSGSKPGAVFVYLIEQHDTKQPSMSQHGNAAIEIRSADAVADIDFRPFVGLNVHLCDVVGDTQRYRQIAKGIAAAKPARLVMPIETADGMVVHQLEHGKTETF